MSQKKLMTTTLELLGKAEESLPEIAHNVGISYYWLRKFKSGEINDPSVNKVEDLYNYLSKQPLFT